MKRKRIGILFIIAILFVFLIFRGLPLAINAYLNAHAERIVSEMITRTPDLGDHSVAFGHILFDFDFYGTYLELGDIRIDPNEDIPQEKVKINLAAKSAHLTGFSWTSYFLENSIMLDSAYLESVMVRTTSPSLDSLELGSPREQTGDNYEMISVRKVRFNRLSFYNNDSSNDSTRMSIKDLTVAANGFKLSKEDIANKEALFHVDLVEGYMDEAAFHFNQYRNAIYAKDLSFNSGENHLLIGGLELDNKLERYEYINQFKFETDWIELDQGELELKGLNFQSFFRKKVLQAELIQAKNLVVNIFRDKRKPKDVDRRPAMIHTIIRELPKDLMIGEFRLENGLIAYQERPDTDAPRAGAIHFEDINASIHNITNIPDVVASNNKMEVKASGKVMGKGKVDMTVLFTLDSPEGEFHMKGSVGSMPLAALNEMIGPETKMAIREGVLDNMYFNIYANDSEGTGDLIMKYHDLKIKMLDSDYKDNQNFIRKAGAFLANAFVVKNNNPSHKGELAEGKVYVKKKPSSFIFNYWWELILSGMMSTLSGDSEAEMREAAKGS